MEKDPYTLEYGEKTIPTWQRLCRKEANKWYFDLTSGAYLYRTVATSHMLLASEITEAMEGHRKDILDKHLPKYPAEVVEYADACIRLMDITAENNIDLEEAVMKSHPHYSPSLTTLGEWRYKNCDSLFATRSPYEVNLEMLDCVLRAADSGSGAEYLKPKKAAKHFARLLILLCWACAARGYSIEVIMVDKMFYNRERADHKKAERIKPGGKAV